MKLFQKAAAALALAWLGFSPALAQEAVPINATFGFQWTPVDWSTPVRVTATEGAAGLPNGKVISIVTRDRLDIIEGHITSDYVLLFFSSTDVVYAMYDRIPAGYDPATDTASVVRRADDGARRRGTISRRERQTDDSLQGAVLASRRHVRGQRGNHDDPVVKASAVVPLTPPIAMT